VTTLQSQFAEQKQQSKRLFSDKISSFKTAIVQVRKKAQTLKSESSQLYDHGRELQQVVLKRQGKTGQLQRQTAALQAECSELEIDLEEINSFKQSLKYELEQEINLKNNIQTIALKYKKLMQEHRKEKEKLAQSNAQSRKII
jgi:chromosome segregation ATPase